MIPSQSTFTYTHMHSPLFDSTYTLWCVGLRGVTANLVVIEEAAFISPPLFFEVITPLLGVAGTAIVAISTPHTDSDNYYTTLMDLKDPDDPNSSLFKTIRIGLACEQCVAEGVAASCPHKQDLIPPWKSADRQRKMRKIMESDEHLFLRENLGMLSNANVYVFRGPSIQWLHDAPHYRLQSSPDILYCAVDPSGGGSQSDYAMVTVAIEGGNYVIVGIDRTPSADSDDVNDMLYRHWASIRSDPRYKSSVIVLYVESNMSYIETDRVVRIAQQLTLQPMYITSHDSSGKNRPGVITTEQNKIAYCDTLKRLLTDHRIRYCDRMIGSDTLSCLHQLEEQMRQFRRAVKEPLQNPEFTNVRVSFTGKGYNKKDDLVMTLMMALYFSFGTRDEPQFTRLCQKNGWVIDK